MEELLYWSRCSCGAITLMSENEQWSVLEENLPKLCPDIDLTQLEQLQDSYMCDHCVNHWGLDLCGCGSGEPFGQCENGYDECKKPMQVLGRYTHVVANDALALRFAGAAAAAAGVFDEPDEQDSDPTFTDISKEDIAEALASEKKLATQIETLKQRIVGKIRNSVLPGVQPLSGNVSCAIVSFNAVKASRALNLSAQYYIPDSQASLVQQKLDGLKDRSVKGFFDALREMSDKEYVRIGENRYELNPKSLEAIREVLTLNP